MKNVPPSVRAALKRRGKDQILEQEGDYQTYKAQIDQLLHDDKDTQMSDDVMIPDYEADLSPKEKKTNEEISNLAKKYSKKETPEWQAMKEEYNKSGMIGRAPFNLNKQEFDELLKSNTQTQKQQFAVKYKDLISSELDYNEQLDNDYQDFKNSQEYKDILYSQLLSGTPIGRYDLSKKLTDAFNNKYSYDFYGMINNPIDRDIAKYSAFHFGAKNYQPMKYNDFLEKYGNLSNREKEIQWALNTENWIIDNNKTLENAITSGAIDIHDLINYVKGKK